MCAAGDSVIHCSRPQADEEEMIINVTAWQLPPQGGVGCDDAATAESCNDGTPPGIDECHCFICPESPRDCDIVPTNAELFSCAARGRASTWPDCTVQTSSVRTNSEGDIKFQSPSRPFLSLMLPEWVHEKAAEDEAAGMFPTRSAMSSIVSSPASSRASSPQVPSRAGSHSMSVRRSGVNWADLADSEEEDDGPIFYPWSAVSTATSTISTATSSPVAINLGFVDQFRKEEKAVEIVTLGEIFNSSQGLAIGVDYQLASPQTLQASGGTCAQTHVHSKAAGHLAIRWVDLVESDVDPLDYAWSYDGSILVDASLAQEPCQVVPTEVASVDFPNAQPVGTESGRAKSVSVSPSFVDLESKLVSMKIMCGNSEESQAGNTGELATVMSPKTRALSSINGTIAPNAFQPAPQMRCDE